MNRLALSAVLTLVATSCLAQDEPTLEKSAAWLAGKLNLTVKQDRWAPKRGYHQVITTKQTAQVVGGKLVVKHEVTHAFDDGSGDRDWVFLTKTYRVDVGKLSSDLKAAGVATSSVGRLSFKQFAQKSNSGATKWHSLYAQVVAKTANGGEGVSETWVGGVVNDAGSQTPRYISVTPNRWTMYSDTVDWTSPRPKMGASSWFVRREADRKAKLASGSEHDWRILNLGAKTMEGWGREQVDAAAATATRKTNTFTLFAEDSAMAKRVIKALAHVIKLSGGEDEPF
jgi:hypothetical protein